VRFCLLGEFHWWKTKKLWTDKTTFFCRRRKYNSEKKKNKRYREKNYNNELKERIHSKNRRRGERKEEGRILRKVIRKLLSPSREERS
jgi:hypothetical protein